MDMYGKAAEMAKKHMKGSSIFDKTPEEEDEPSEEGLPPLEPMKPPALESKQPDAVDKTIGEALPPQSERLSRQQLVESLTALKSEQPELADVIDPLVESLGEK